MAQYPQREKIDRLLKFLHGELQRAHEKGESDVSLVFSNGPLDDKGPGLFLKDFTGVGDSIGISNGEALSMFRQLGEEGHITIDFGSAANKQFGYVRLRSLATLGYEQIGELENPRDEFLQRLDAIEEAIRNLQDPNVSEEQKEEAKKAVSTLRQFSLGFASSGTYDLLIRSLTGGL